MGKFYAVRRGVQSGIYDSWDLCKSKVSGFSGAEYKSFNTYDEALAYLNGADIKIEAPKPDEKHVILYVDGSFRDGLASFGVYINHILKDYQYYSTVDASMFSSLRNIVGELVGVLVGVEICNFLGFKDIILVYDYVGILNWYNGTWNARTDLAAKYSNSLHRFVHNNNINLSFFKVSGHTGVVGNTRADKLAKLALNSKYRVCLDDVLSGVVAEDSLFRL